MLNGIDFKLQEVGFDKIKKQAKQNKY